MRPGESAPAKPRNPSGLYVSALPIATQLLPVTEQQTTKKPRTMRDEGRKEEKKKVEEYLSNRAAPVESVTMSMVAYGCVTPSEFASAGSVPNYESQCTSIFPIYATITSIIYYFLLPFSSFSFSSTSLRLQTSCLFEKYYMSVTAARLISRIR